MIPVMIVAMLGGPSVAGIVMTGVVDGRAGYRDLVSRLLQWRVGIGWYASTLLLAPLLMTATGLVLSLLHHESLPHVVPLIDKAPILRMGLTAGLAVGFCEELGWTGFVIPRLRLRFSALTTGLIVGCLWGVWHLLVNLCSSGTPAGALSWPIFLGGIIFSMLLLPAFRILMVWVNDRTSSLLVAMLMHFSLTASDMILPKAMTGMTGNTWTLILSAALWIVVVAAIVARRRQMSFEGGRGNLGGTRR